MPFYEYKCSGCSFEFEELQDIGEDPLSICPKCKGDLKKKFSISSGNVTYNDAKEYYEKVIKPEAKEIADKIRGGDEDAAADIFGEPS